MVPFLPLLTALLPTLSTVLDRAIPDQGQRERAQAEIQAALIANEAQLQQSVVGVIQAEAKSEHWLAATWRPITMLTFASLLVARWLGFTAPGLSEAEVLKLWSIVELGLGGYVIGRSFEKVVPQVAGAITASRK